MLSVAVYIVVACNSKMVSDADLVTRNLACVPRLAKKKRRGPGIPVGAL